MNQLLQSSTRRRWITLGIIAAIVLSAMALGGISIVASRIDLALAGALITAWAGLVGVLITQIVSASTAAAQRQREAEAEETRRELERLGEEASRERQLEIASQRAQDEALQAYLEQVGQLLLEKNLRDSEVGSEVSTLARTQTLSVLNRLDGPRKRSVLQFLYESSLIMKSHVVVNLNGADLREINLFAAALSRAWLSEADLSGSRLSAANLHAADLHSANLSEVDLSAANVSDANLNRANLTEADLSAANLIGANLHKADLSRGDLRRAFLRAANLHEANLQGAFLEGVHLEGANLQGAHLEEANLQWAYFGDANLEAARLQGATMPNGQMYVEWLKDKEGTENGENSGAT
jgi:uncharacterized protein YjbI with pentapeptide repeats